MKREQRIQWFEETLGLKDINKNKGTINCAHCALRLDTYISQGGTNGNVRPVPKTSAKLFTHPTFDGSKIKRSYTNDKRVLDRTNLNTLTAESLVVYDITSDNGEPILDLTFDDNHSRRKSSARLIRAERDIPLAEQLKGCQRRAKDGTAYGFIWLTHKNNTQEGHVINYFVDSAENNHHVYFLDAQLGRVVDGSDYFNRFHEDIFYLPTYPPEGFVIKKEPAPIIQVKLERENIVKTEVDGFIEQVVKAVEQKDLVKLNQLKNQKSLGVRNSKKFSAMHILAMNKDIEKTGSMKI